MTRLRDVVGWLCVAAAGAATVGGASASGSVDSASLGSLRAWGATEIRSLDPTMTRTATPGAPSARSTSAPRRARSASASASPSPPRDQRLSNETTFTRWAYVARIAPIYQRPRSASPRITRLHWSTEDGFPEIYLLRRAHWDPTGQEWVQLRIPMRPNGRTGWVRRRDLGALHLTHRQLVVDRRRLRMYLFERGRRIWSAPIGIGRPSAPTPPGRFWIRERFAIADRSSGYWPYAFGTSDYSTLTDWPGGGVVGIHGPYYQDSSIPGRISHGCLRLHPADDAWLAHHVGLGTPLRVR